MDDQEIIKAVAEKVMEWKIDDTGDFWQHGYQNPRCKNKTLSVNMIDYDSEGEVYTVPFDPLTDANHWMMVVERMANKGFITFELCRWPNGEEWDAAFNGIRIWADIPGRAVCLAALEAVEEK